jgi:molecular chaperone DnaK
MDALSKEFYTISSRIYQNVQKQQAEQAQQGQQAQSGPKQGNDGTVDAEYKIIDDDDKK